MALETFAPDNSISRLFVFGGWRAREDGQQPRCKYRVTATIKADTIYELETIKADLIKARQRSFALTQS
jgi:hypothetical protein